MLPIRTALELIAEGSRMRSCVAQMCRELVRGGRWIFSGSVEQELATVEVLRVAGRYTLGEARGLANRELSASARSALHRWLRALNGEEAREEARTP